MNSKGRASLSCRPKFSAEVGWSHMHFQFRSQADRAVLRIWAPYAINPDKPGKGVNADSRPNREGPCNRGRMQGPLRYPLRPGFDREGPLGILLAQPPPGMVLADKERQGEGRVGPKEQVGMLRLSPPTSAPERDAPRKWALKKETLPLGIHDEQARVWYYRRQEGTPLLMRPGVACNPRCGGR